MRDADHSREPRQCRTRGQTPATPASHTRTAPPFLDFPATVTTDQGRLRSLDHSHPGANGSRSPAQTAHGARKAEPAGQPPPASAVQDRLTLSAVADHPEKSSELRGPAWAAGGCRRVRESFTAATRSPDRRAWWSAVTRQAAR